ncbi:MAG: ribbon-helix-helix domain-containing protein [Alphaproteobacteria bacterium]|nr:ribbon-helix-helix domain-containing protein [Alphaproteobacteria bacterium SS10]
MSEEKPLISKSRLEQRILRCCSNVFDTNISDEMKYALGRIYNQQLVGRNIKIHGRRTSMRLTPASWTSLREIADIENTTIDEIVSVVSDITLNETSVTSAVRVFIEGYYREKARLSEWDKIL